MVYRYDLSDWGRAASDEVETFRFIGFTIFAIIIAFAVIVWILVFFLKVKQSTMEKRVIQRARMIHRENRQAGMHIIVDYVVEDLDTGERIRVTAPSNRKQLHNLIVGDTGRLVCLDAGAGRLANIMQDFCY